MKKIGIAIVILALIVVGGRLVWRAQHGNESAPTGKPQATAPTGKDKAGKTAAPATEAPAKPKPTKPEQPPAAKPEPAVAYCQAAAKDNADTAATKALAKQGGLVAILQHEAALNGDPYTCGQYYLAHGGNIDAQDARADSEHLTPLLFAIKRNDPRMVTYVIDHGADLKKRGGPNDVRPYGYAVFLALQNRSTNYNQVIAKLDKALKSAASQSGGG